MAVKLGYFSIFQETYLFGRILGSWFNLITLVIETLT